MAHELNSSGVQAGNKNIKKSGRKYFCKTVLTKSVCLFSTAKCCKITAPSEIRVKHSKLVLLCDGLTYKF